MEYFPKDALIFIDESHATIPQLNGMYRGDRARKETLINYGFRLPSALDNRPLRFEEFDALSEPADLRLRDPRGLRTGKRPAGGSSNRSSGRRASWTR